MQTSLFPTRYYRFKDVARATACLVAWQVIVCIAATGSLTAQYVAGGRHQSLGVYSDGTARGWGDNTNYKIGNGTNTQQLTPVAVSGLTGVVAVATGQNGSYALKSNGTVWAWGANSNGQCGDGTTTTPRTTPVQVVGPGGVGFLTGITEIASMGSHCLALKSDGTLWAWGLNMGGALGVFSTINNTGNGTYSQSCKTTNGGNSDTTASTAGLVAGMLVTGTGVQTGTYITAITSATTFTMSKNATFTGTNSLSFAFAAPVQVKDNTGAGFLANIISIGAGYGASAAAASNGSVYTWGDNNGDQLGRLSFNQISTLKLSNDTVTTTTTGTLQVGMPISGSGLPANATVKSIVDGTTFILSGLATSAGSFNLSFKPIPQLPGQVLKGASTSSSAYLEGVAMVRMGSDAFYAVKSDGTLWAWGQNGSGKLGDGTSSTRSAPVQVKGVGGSGFLTCISSVAPGLNHTMALKQDGTVYAWGNNGTGQLGNNTVTGSTTAVQVLGNGGVGFLTGIVSLGGGGFGYSLALKNDGTVWAWGYNATGTLSNTQGGSLGDGTLVNKLTPVQVSSMVGPTVSVPVITGNNFVCSGSSNTYSIPALTGATSYTWTLPSGWSGSSTTTSINTTAGSTGGTISVSATTACGAVPAAQSLTVSAGVPATPGSITGNAFICSGSSNTYSIATVAGAISYTWTLPSGWSGSSTTNSISTTANATGGTISVTANNICGSSTAQTLIVAIGPPATPGSISGGPSVCSNSANTFSVTAVPGATSYTWTLPSGWSGSSTTNSINATTNTTPGNVTVIANNSCGSSSAQTLSVGINTPPATPGSISGNTQVCTGTSNTYSIGAVSGATSYTWTLPSGWSGSSTTTSISTVANGATGNVQVTANNGCGASAAQSVLVAVGPPAVPVAINGNNPICAGTSNTYSVTAVPGATSYTWTLPSGWSGSSTTSSINTTANSSSGNILVRTNNNCGASANQTLSVVVGAPATPGAISGSTSVYWVTINTYSVSAVPGATSYTWTLPSGWSGTSTTNTITATATGAGGNITVKANNQCGSSAVSTLAVTVGNQPGTLQKVCGGRFHSLAICEDGTGSVRAWGDNSNSKLGDGTSTQRTLPVQVSGLTNIIAVTAAQYSSAALRSDGTVWCWGGNMYGQLGNNTSTPSAVPVQVHGPGNVGFLTGIIAISGGGNHIAALKSDGTVWTWGNNGYGQLGINSTVGGSNGVGSAVPVQVMGPGAVGFLTNVIAIAAGYGGTYAVKNDGSVWAWGDGGNGMIGDGTSNQRLTPVQVVKGASASSTAYFENASTVTVGNSALLLRNDGTVWSWGFNGSGTLGINTSGASQSSPVQVHGAGNVGFLTGVAAINSSLNAGMALKSDGTMWVWGNNTQGGLGDNTTTQRNVPVQVLGYNAVGFLTNVTDLGGGGLWYTLARTSDGALWAWGNNSNGQLGDGTTTDKLTPIRVAAPEVTLGSSPTICFSANTQTANLPYTSPVNSPTSYKIVWDGTAHTAGFTDVAFGGALPANNIVLQVPASAAANTYNGTLTLRSACGPLSVDYPFTLTILPAIITYNVTGGACSPVAIGLSGSQTGVDYQLVRNGGTNVGSPVAGTGAALNFGAQGTTGTYSVTGSNAGCSVAMTGVSTVNICTSTWVGGNSTNWFDQTNWSPAAVPDNCASNVIIPTGTTFAPVVSGAGVSVGNVSIASGVILSLQGQTMSVCGNWTGGSSTNAAVTGTGTLSLAGSASQSIAGHTKFDILLLNNTFGAVLSAGANVSVATGLHLQSGNLNVTAGTLRMLSANANTNSYIDDFTTTPVVYAGTITGNITVDRYVPVIGYNQHFISSPVNSPALTQINASGPDGSYILPTANCDETKSGLHTPYGSVFVYNDGYRPNGYCMLGNWMIKSAGNMENGKGYSAYLTGNATLSLTGAANTGSIAIGGLNNSGYDSVQTLQGQWIESGWNLVGNPYPSAIDLTEFRTPNGFQNQVQVWKTTGPFAGSWQADVINNVPGHLIIPPFQAFMVRTSTGSLGMHTYPFNQGERVRNTNVPFYRTGTQNTLQLELDYNGVKDMTTVAFNPSATFNFDDEFDANKYNGNAGRPTMYSMANCTKWYAINTLPELTNITTVPVGLRPEVNGTMVITASGIESFDPTTYIILEDKKTHTWHNLRDGAYTFATDKGDMRERFVLHFTPPAQLLIADASCDVAGQINIEQPGTASWSYTLADANSATVATGVLDESNPVSISVNAGTYLLTLKDNAGYTVAKNIKVEGLQQVTAQFIVSTNTALVQQNVSFNSTGTGAAGYTWDFGDGSTGTGNTSTHQYSAAGVYTVVLTVTNTEGCTAVTSRTVTITAREVTGIPDVSTTNGINIWSNSNRVFIDFSKQDRVEAEIDMYNLLGQLISHESYGRNSVYTKELSNVSAAYIIVRVSNNSGVTTKKIFIAGTAK